MAVSEMQIQIAGERVRLITRIIEREATLDEFVELLSRGRPVKTPLLPNGTRLFASGKRFAWVVFETPPQPRKIMARTRLDNRVREFTLHLPWMQWYWMVWKEIGDTPQVFWSMTHDSVLDFSTPIHRVPLPNYFPDGRGMCLGDISMSAVTPSTLHKAHTDVNTIFGSIWNTDLMPPFQDMGLGPTPDNRAAVERLDRDRARCQEHNTAENRNMRDEALLAAEATAGLGLWQSWGADALTKLFVTARPAIGIRDNDEAAATFGDALRQMEAFDACDE